MTIYRGTHDPAFILWQWVLAKGPSHLIGLRARLITSLVHWHITARADE
ncbi:hypothetical protein KDH_33760 [Dictyobacter sp. S3.2.2.5]|uniref:Uncharacterized protein n=1 Tax=Dictyobacter halimunensis TaxID=3026934 RepID=A0ABQ6FS09_9CHLR|nr:hypothetical protein KDH_33760 [Dictyobacter sp. S3.2.2.5]